MRSRTAAANSARHSRASGTPVPSPDVAAAAETLVPGFRRDDAKSIGSTKTRLVARNHHPLDLGRTFVNLGDLGVAEVALQRHFLGITHPAMNLHGLVGDPHRGFRRGELRDRGL